MNGLIFFDQPEDNLTATGISFSHLKESAVEMPIGPEVPTDKDKKPVVRRKKDEVVGNIVKAESSSNETIKKYNDNNAMLVNTIGQLDILASELKTDLDEVRSSRTLKRKYDYLSMLSSNIGSTLSTKVQAIKELNNTIKNANDMDYRISKDNKDADAGNQDKYIMDMYNAFISSPVSTGAAGMSMLGPNTSQMTLNNVDNIVRVDSNPQAADMGYQKFLNNMTPEQNLMRYESNPDVKQVVVYDQANGNKFFQVMNTRTGEVIPNVPVRDAMFMEDTTIDTRNRIAKNINLNESYPLVILNEGKGMSEY